MFNRANRFDGRGPSRQYSLRMLRVHEQAAFVATASGGRRDLRRHLAPGGSATGHGEEK